MNPYLESQIAPFVNKYRKMNKPSKRRKSKGLDQNEKNMCNKALQLMNNWKNSKEGKTIMKVMRNYPMEEMSKAMDATITRGQVEDIIQELSTYFAEMDWPVNAVSFGVNFEAELVVGLSGTLGVAVNPTNTNVDTSTFLSVGLDEGVTEGAIGDIQIGVWTSEPKDLGGGSFSVELLLDAVGGGTIAAYWGYDGSFQGITIAAGVGEEAGIEIKESYTFILTDEELGIPPIWQRPADHMLIFNKITAKNIAAGDGKHNEIYFKFKPDDGAYFPHPYWDYFAMAEDDKWYCGRSVKFNEKVKVKLYDSDDGPDDDLGSITIELDDLEMGDDVTFKIKSSHGLDDRDFHLHAVLMY